MNGETNTRENQLALFYLRLGLGFVTFWSAWDVIVHQSQINAFFAAFPGLGVLSGQLVVAWFAVLLIIGGMLLTGWHFREATAVMSVLLLCSLLIFTFMTPKVNAVLGPMRPLALKSLVWLGGCLVLMTHPTDPFNPERRRIRGFSRYAEKTQFVFRLLLGTYCIWDGLLKAMDANGYMNLLSGALIQLPLISHGVADVLVVVIYVVQLLAGVMILSGIKFRWALMAILVIALIQLLGIQWFASKGLLRPGGRFMMRDIIIVASAVYFWLAGAGVPILKILVAGKTRTPSDIDFGAPGDLPPGSRQL